MTRTMAPVRVVSRVRAILRCSADLPSLTIEHVAEELGLSVRVLQKRLTRGGVRYRALLDEARQHRVLQSLRGPDLPLRDLARRTGYADATTLLRAFKRWTGMSLGRYRVAIRRKRKKKSKTRR
jgi:AraC-like DNA-binding protein